MASVAIKSAATSAARAQVVPHSLILSAAKMFNTFSIHYKIRVPQRLGIRLIQERMRSSGNVVHLSM